MRRLLAFKKNIIISNRVITYVGWWHIRLDINGETRGFDQHIKTFKVYDASFNFFVASFINKWKYYFGLFLSSIAQAVP